MALPANVSYCTVKGRFIAAILDGNDAGREPDGVAIPNLTLTFSAGNEVAKVIRDTTSTPPTTILANKIVCHTDDDGVLVDDSGTPDILLIASDDTDLAPHDWAWTVKMQAPSIPTQEFSFVAPAGGTIDLAVVAPVPPNPGSDIPAWTLVVNQAEAAAAAAQDAADSIDPTTIVRSVNDATPDGAGNVSLAVIATVAAADITDSTTVGRAVIKATDAAAARSAIGAGTSNVAIGTSAGQAADAAALATSLAGKVPTTRTVAGHALSADVTLAVADVAGAAPLVSPALTGTPTAPTRTAGDNSTAIATTAYIKAAIDALIAGAPGALDTLNEIATQLGNDESAVAALTTTVAGKVPATRTVAGHALSADVTLVKGDVGLGNVDNTADTAKPVSTAQQAALNLKADLISPTFTGDPKAPTPTAGDSDTSIATTAFVQGELAAVLSRLSALESKVGGTQVVKATSATTWGAWDGTGWTGSVSTSAALIRLYFSEDTVMTTIPTFYNADDMWFPNPSQT